MLLLPIELWWLWEERERRRGTGETRFEEGEGRELVLRLSGFKKVLCCVKKFFFFVFIIIFFNIMLTWKIVEASEA